MIFHFPFPSFLKVAFHTLRRKFTKILKKSSLYAESLLIFIHETPVVENRQLEKLENYYGARQHIPFLHEQFAHLHTGNTLKKSSNIAADENIIKNNYIFVMLWNLSVISHLIFPQSFFFFYFWRKI